MQGINLHPMTHQAVNLMHEGILTLSKIEANGMRIDTSWLKSQHEELTNKIDQLTQEILSTDEVKLWQKKYGTKFSLDSTTQLRDILYNELGEEPTKVTAAGAAAVDREVLSQLAKKYSFLEKLLLLRKYKKARDTYLKNLLNETVDGWLHPTFNLHTVRTFRSSSSNPNFQNIPIRDPDIGKIIRKAFIPRDKDFMFGGCDYGAQEVKIAACYHKDPEMLKYLKGHGDLHRDVAAMCYMCTPEEVSKQMRKVAKNKFTFPQFYGDYYKNCAKALWQQMQEMELKLQDGTPLQEHLASKGIESYPQFEKHIQDVEYDFWNNKFAVYNQWKRRWINKYYRRGYVDLLTGFRCQGVMSKNDVINYPVQGAAFHCLLWSLIRVNRWLNENKLRSKIVGQIHDEIVMDLHKDEKDYVLPMIKKIMTEDIVKEWPWIIAPLEVEAEFCDPGESWYDKKEIPIE